MAEDFLTLDKVPDRTNEIWFSTNGIYLVIRTVYPKRDWSAFHHCIVLQHEYNDWDGILLIFGEDFKSPWETCKDWYMIDK